MEGHLLSQKLVCYVLERAELEHHMNAKSWYNGIALCIYHLQNYKIEICILIFTILAFANYFVQVTLLIGNLIVAKTSELLQHLYSRVGE